MDRKLINLLQTSFPITTEPFAAIGDKFGLSEKEILNRVQKFKKTGIIRRIGGVFEARKLGYQSCLAAARVPVNQLNRVAKFISQYPEVTHNYRRSGSYNLWFTLTVSSPRRLSAIKSAIENRQRIKVHLLPASKIFKINAQFILDGK